MSGSNIIYDLWNPFDRLWRIDSVFFTKMAAYALAARKAVKLCRTYSIDAIIGTGVHECFGFYLTETSVPLIISIRGDYTQEIPLSLTGDPNKGRHLKMYESMAFMGLKSSSCTVFVSKWLQSHLNKQLLPEVQYVVPNPLRISDSSNEIQLKRDLRLPLKTKLILSVTSFHSKHRFEGMRIFLKAARLIVNSMLDVHFIIIGGSKINIYFEQINKISEDLPITFLGYRDDIFDILKQGDIFLLCSVLDTFSNATLEAMSVGLPCVATRTGGIPEIIIDGVDGLLVDIEPASIAGAVLKLIKDDSLAKKIGDAACRKVSNDYSWEKIGAMWEDIIHHVINNRYRNKDENFISH